MLTRLFGQGFCRDQEEDEFLLFICLAAEIKDLEVCLENNVSDSWWQFATKTESF